MRNRSETRATHALLIAVLTCGPAVLGRFLLLSSGVFEGRFLFAYLAIVFSSWIGGFRAGVFATMITAATDVLLRPADEGKFGSASSVVHLLLFVASGFVVSVLFRRILRIIEAVRASRERAEKSEARFRMLAELMPQFVWEVDSLGRVIYANQKFFEYSGLPSNCDRLRDWIAAVYPCDARKVEDCIATARANGTPVGIEFRLRKSDGTYRWFIARAVPTKQHGTAQAIWLGTLTDIHEQKLLQAALSDGEERFRQLAENLKDQLFYVTDLTLQKITYVSPSYEWIWGRSVASLLDDRYSFVDSIHPDDRLKCQKMLEKQLSGEASAHEYRVIRPDGTIRWILDRSFPIKDAQGHVYRVTGIAEDITEKYLAESENSRISEAFKKSEHFYRQIFTVSPEPMFIVDPENLSFVDVNEAAIRQYGYSRDEFKILTLDLLRPNEDRLAFLEVFKSRPSGNLIKYPHTVRHSRKDGSLIDIEITIGDVYFDGKCHTLILASDVTAQLAAQSSLQEAKMVAEAANESKTRFLANMSHEIRTPLGAILGFAELLHDCDLTQGEREEYVQTILRNGKLLSKLINDVLDLSKIESGRLEIEMLEVDPLGILEDVTTLLRPQAKKKGLELLVVSDDKLPDEIVTDPTRLQQILINVIGNAIKFTSTGRVEARIRVLEPATLGARPFLQFLITDSGPGLKPEQFDKLFKPFSQADSSTTRKFGGTGLGLVLSKRFARALGGDLTLLHSEAGKGSTFALTVDIGPRATIEKGQPQNHLYARSSGLPGKSRADIGSGSGSGESARVPLEKLEVLLIDDAPDNRALISRIVTKAGAHITCAVDGQEGVDEALKKTYDVVLMDIQMPKLDGFQAIEILRSTGYRGCVIALTALAMKGDREKCLARGFNDYLAKPLNREELLAALERFKTDRPARSEKRANAPAPVH